MKGLWLKMNRQELEALDDVLDVILSVMGNSMVDCYFRGIPQSDLISLHKKVMSRLDLEYGPEVRNSSKIVDGRERMVQTRFLDQNDRSQSIYREVPE